MSGSRERPSAGPAARLTASGYLHPWAGQGAERLEGSQRLTQAMTRARPKLASAQGRLFDVVLRTPVGWQPDRSFRFAGSSGTIIKPGHGNPNALLKEIGGESFGGGELNYLRPRFPNDAFPCVERQSEYVDQFEHGKGVVVGCDRIEG